jgi:hypothetical protein
MYEEQGYVNITNLEELEILKEEDPRLKEIVASLGTDIQVSQAVKSFWDSPFYFIYNFIQKIVDTVTGKSTETKKTKPEKEKILKDLEKILKEKAKSLNFTQELKRLVAIKTSTLKELSDYAMVEYSYLNKLINGKLPEQATISRDLIVRLCLAMKLNLLQSNELMSKAGYLLSGQNERDITLCICIESGAGVILTNELLEERKQKLLI